MQLLTILTIIFFVHSAFGFSFLEIDVRPETVSEFDPNAYVGRWYQVYASLIPSLTYERKTFCVVADYTRFRETELHSTSSTLESKFTKNYRFRN